jgi:hypothetical protein
MKLERKAAILTGAGAHLVIDGGATIDCIRNVPHAPKRVLRCEVPSSLRVVPASRGLSEPRRFRSPT